MKVTRIKLEEQKNTKEMEFRVAGFDKNPESFGETAGRDWEELGNHLQ